MFLIDSKNKKATSLEQKSFGELGLSERHDLQEWVCGNPEILGEQLLIIQKEFAGFDETRERLDLLALDKDGNLVVIENKLDDSGRDVTWQALKYASYCAPFTKHEICDIYQKHLGNSAVASEKICEFLDNDDFDNIELNSGVQRIVLVAAKFRKEVTTTVLYLNSYQLDIKCIKVTPYKDCDRLYLDAEQIIPVQDVDDYQIRLSIKKQEDVSTTKAVKNSKKLIQDFWEAALPFISKKVEIFKNHSATGESWITGSSGNSHISFEFKILKNEARVGIFINTASQEKNKQICETLFRKKDELERAVGTKIIWNNSPENKTSRLYVSFNKFSLNDKETWLESSHWLADNMEKLYATFKKPLDDAVKSIST